ncbi:hypothetical protein ABTZ99_13535 [Actinosynnema sp. NPDC002837]
MAWFRRKIKRASVTHDWTAVDYDYDPIDRQSGMLLCWTFTGTPPERGDFLILQNGPRTTRYRVKAVGPRSPAGGVAVHVVFASRQLAGPDV